jgi:putative oxidoreductase
MYKKIVKLLFNEQISSSTRSTLLLFARIIFGFLFLTHGIAKIFFYGKTPDSFPDPLGFGNALSLWLVLFAEVVCSVGFMFGALFRLCLVPMIFTMCIAFFVIHAGDPLTAKEPSLMYLTLFVLLFITGPGKYSIDGVARRIFLSN